MAAPERIAGHLSALSVSVPVVHGFWADGSFCGTSARHLGPTVEQTIPPVRAYLGDDFEARPFSISTWTPSGRCVQLVPGAEIVTCVPFVASDPDPNVQRFVVRARAMGEGELVTHVAFTHYNALMALRAAMEKSGEASAAGGLAGFQGLALETPTGLLTFDAHGYCTMPMFVASA